MTMMIRKNYWVTAEVGEQRIQLVVSETHLMAILDVLAFNHATHVEYVIERGRGTTTFTFLAPYLPSPMGPDPITTTILNG
jgi:hypothetical protein